MYRPLSVCRFSQVDYYQGKIDEYNQAREKKLEEALSAVEDDSPEPTDDFDQMIEDRSGML